MQAPRSVTAADRLAGDLARRCRLARGLSLLRGPQVPIGLSSGFARLTLPPCRPCTPSLSAAPGRTRRIRGAPAALGYSMRWPVPWSSSRGRRASAGLRGGCHEVAAIHAPPPAGILPPTCARGSKRAASALRARIGSTISLLIFTRCSAIQPRSVASVFSISRKASAWVAGGAGVRLRYRRQSAGDPKASNSFLALHGFLSVHLKDVPKLLDRCELCPEVLPVFRGQRVPTITPRPSNYKARSTRRAAQPRPGTNEAVDSPKRYPPAATCSPQRACWVCQKRSCTAGAGTHARCGRHQMMYPLLASFF